MTDASEGVVYVTWLVGMHFDVQLTSHVQLEKIRALLLNYVNQLNEGQNDVYLSESSGVPLDGWGLQLDRPEVTP